MSRTKKTGTPNLGPCNPTNDLSERDPDRDWAVAPFLSRFRIHPKHVYFVFAEMRLKSGQNIYLMS